jgi:hypothetical protein
MAKPHIRLHVGLKRFGKMGNFVQIWWAHIYDNRDYWSNLQDLTPAFMRSEAVIRHLKSRAKP